MRFAVFALAAAVPLAGVAAPVQAQEATRVSSAAITTGDYADAEKVLMRELRIHPGRPELLLNLAAVYAHTGRADQARALYRQVLAQENVLMDMRNQSSFGSHALAEAGLRRLDRREASPATAAN
ncbi:tetratricopeptide repeat protein [Sphingomonas sp.]|uniref:tetratricopeptide repeat protein n=1 Tax=Sphingomonas sp. TaxID=28214 RepID=UPI001B05D053|nr:tetratricopeptide repeat protein [Sphingomonas sp.]MBO9712758.1 tetratricopeptide repeat protein [Sphingomonas sp.]